MIKVLILLTALLSVNVYAESKENKASVKQYQTQVLNHMGQPDKVAKRISKLLNKKSIEGWEYESQYEVKNGHKISIIFVFSKR